MANDVSNLIASFRAKNPVETIGKTDEQVADLMLKNGGLTAGELSMLSEAFGKKGSEEPIGDFIVGQDKGEPEMPGEQKAGGLLIALGVVGGVLGFLTRGKINPSTLAKTLGIGVGIAVASGLTSCQSDVPDVDIDIDKDLTVDFSSLANEIKGLREDQKKYFEKIEEKWDEYTKEQQNFYLKIVTLLKNMEAGDKAREALLVEILNEAQKGNAANQAKLDAILDILGGLKKEQSDYNSKFVALLNEILGSIKEGSQVNNEAFNKLMGILNSIKNDGNVNNEALLDMIKNMWGDIAAGQEESIEILKKLKEANVAGNKDLQELIKTLYADGQINAEERNQKILEAINNVAGVVASLEATVESSGDAICKAIQGLEADLKAILEAYKNGQADHEAILNELSTIVNKLTVNNELGATTNYLLTELLKDADEVLNKPDAEIKDYSEVLNKILDAINDVVVGVEDIKIGMGENNDKIEAALKEIIDNQKVQSEQLEALGKQSAAQHKELVAKGDEIIAAIKAVGIDMNKGIGDIINQLKAEHADLAAQLEAMASALGVKIDDNGQAIVNAINGLEANIDAVKEAIENLINVSGSDVDLTTTNNLIQTVINLMNKNSNGNQNFDLGEVTAMLAQTNKMMEALLNKEGPDMSAFMDALAEIRDAIKNIKITNGNGGAVDLTTTNNLIQTCISQLSALVSAQSKNSEIMSSVTNLGVQLTEVISNLQSGNVTTDEINAKLDKIMEAISKLSG